MLDHPYFKDAERAKLLIDEGKRWIGTPYHHMGDTAGGVDCTKLMGLIFVNAGIMKQIDPINKLYYARDWQTTSDIEVVIMEFCSHLARYITPGKKWGLLKYRPGFRFIAGDVICITINRKNLCNHTGLYIGENKMLHAIEGQPKGVDIVDYTDYWKEKTRYIFRIYEDK